MKKKLNIITILLALFLTNLSLMAQNLPDHTNKIADNVYTYGTVSSGYASMFIVTKEGVIVFEPINTVHAKGMLKAIKTITNKPIKYLLHSHNHWDHSSGGKVFTEVGATSLAHVEAYEWIEANPHTDMELPSESWAGNRKNIELGGVTIELHYLGMNHGLGMTIFRLPKEKIVFIADLVSPDRVPFSVMPDFNINEWMRSLKEIEAMDFKTAVFTHGRTMGTKKDVREGREYIEDLRNAIYTEFKKGTNMGAIPNAIRLPKYENWSMYKEWLPMNAWRLMTDGHMGPFPWRPKHAYENKK